MGNKRLASNFIFQQVSSKYHIITKTLMWWWELEFAYSHPNNQMFQTT
jgi:hypothetical protein